MGSYLTNLSFTLQRVLPFMQRTGDLLQRESLLTNQNQRRQVAEMAIVMGQALEHVAKATGATSHIYKNFELGPQPGQCRLKPNSFEPMFAEIVHSTGVVPRASAEPQTAQTPAQPQSQAQEETKTAPAPAQPATPAKSEDERIMARLGSEFQQMEMLTIISGYFNQIKNFKERV